MIIYSLKWLIFLVGRVFANSPGDFDPIPDGVIPKTLKMVLYTSLFNTQQYKICIKDKGEKSRESSSTLCYLLTFWPGQKCHSRWCTGRKWHILMAVMRGNRVGRNMLMKWDEVKKIPLYSHRLTHRKRVTSELHDSYFRSMTITQAIPKRAEVTHTPIASYRKKLRGVEACQYHRAGVWR